MTSGEAPAKETFANVHVIGGLFASAIPLAGLSWTRVIRLVFHKFQELGSARQVLLWCRQEQITLPAIGYGEMHQVYWKNPVYHTVLAILTNPIYAGAYAFGRTEARTTVVGGRPYRTSGHVKPRDRWTVLLRDHHPGYISWERFESNQRMIAENAHMKSRMGKQRGRGGLSLLVGLMRCGRCGRMLRVHYFKEEAEPALPVCQWTH